MCVKTESSAEGRTILEILKDLKTKFLEAFDYLDCIQVRFVSFFYGYASMLIHGMEKKKSLFVGFSVNSVFGMGKGCVFF